MARSKRFSQQLRQAIKASDMSRYRICQITGIDQSAMSRFMLGKAGLNIESIDKIVDLLGLELTARPKRRGKKVN